MAAGLGDYVENTRKTMVLNESRSGERHGMHQQRRYHELFEGILVTSKFSERYQGKYRYNTSASKANDFRVSSEAD
jgi:hypothetical protein